MRTASFEAEHMTAPDQIADPPFFPCTKAVVHTLAIAGGGLVGTVDSFARQPPVPQKSSREFVGLVEPGAFTGSTALVIGGSRGLGEVTAKLLAAGGAKVTIT